MFDWQDQGLVCLCIALFTFLLVHVCSNEGERSGPGEVPNTAFSVSLQSDRTTRDRQDSLSASLFGPQRCGIAPSVNLEPKMNVSLLNCDNFTLGCIIYINNILLTSVE